MNLPTMFKLTDVNGLVGTSTSVRLNKQKACNILCFIELSEYMQNKPQ